MTDLLPMIPTRDELAVLTDLARTLHGTGMFPRALDTPGKMMAVLLRGRELNLGPMAALTGIHVVDGRATLSAETMLAIARRAGHRIEFVETTDRRCTVRGHRGEQVQELTYTWEDAAKFRKKEHDKWMPATETMNYRGHPAAMLRARAVSALCRCLYSDVTLGLVTPDEAEEIAAQEARDVEVRDVTPGRPVSESAPVLSEAAQMLAPMFGRTGTTDAEEAVPASVKIASPADDKASQEKPAGAACGPNTCTLPAAVATVAKTTEQVYHSPPVTQPAPRGVPRETLADDPAALRAEIRRLIGELGNGALVDAKKAIGLAVSATPTDAQREQMLTYLEQRAEMAAHDRQLQEAEAQEEVMS